MTTEAQGKVVFLVGLFLLGMLLRRFFRSTVAPNVARALLRKGRVRWAMWFKAKSAKKPGCGNCP
jgi:hypothetical protein